MPRAQGGLCENIPASARHRGNEARHRRLRTSIRRRKPSERIRARRNGRAQISSASTCAKGLSGSARLAAHVGSGAFASMRFPEDGPPGFRSRIDAGGSISTLTAFSTAC